MENLNYSSNDKDKFIQRIYVLKEASIFRHEVGQVPFIRNVTSPTLLSVDNGRMELLINDKPVYLQQGNNLLSRTS